MTRRRHIRLTSIRRLSGTLINKIWSRIIFFIVYTAALVCAHNYMDGFHLDFPPSLIPVLGSVTGLLLVFRTNTAYDRYWEGRKLWSQITHNIRTLTRVVWAAVPEKGTEDLVEKLSLINLLVAFPYAVKNYLRGDYSYEAEDLRDLIAHLPRVVPCSYNDCHKTQSFRADRTDVDVEVWPDYLLEKTVITAIEFWWPNLKSPYEQYHTLKFSFSVGEYSGPGTEGKFTIRFQKTLLNCKETVFDRVPVEPPVELISGRTYSVIVQDHSISHLTHRFRNDPTACWGNRYANMSLEATDDLEDVPITMKEIHRKTDYFTQEVSHWSEEFAVIRGVEIGQM